MRVQVDQELNSVLLNFPLTLEFDVTRNTFASANTARFTVYNLGERSRRQIFHDLYDISDIAAYRQVILQAGYESEGSTPLATIFQGNIKSAYSFKHKENWTTVIDCFDGGFGIINGQVSLSVAPKWDINQVVRQLAASMPNVAVGTVDLPSVPSARGLSLFGNAWDIVRRMSGNNTAFIDSEKVNVVAQGTYISPPEGIPLIDSETGLLGTPRKLGKLVEVDMIFEPRIVVNQLVELASQESYYNGEYAVMGIHHHGTISGAVCGDAITTLSLWSGTQALQPAQAAA